jgi:hypothetical protein
LFGVRQNLLIFYNRRRMGTCESNQSIHVRKFQTVDAADRVPLYLPFPPALGAERKLVEVSGFSFVILGGQHIAQRQVAANFAVGFTPFGLVGPSENQSPKMSRTESAAGFYTGDGARWPGRVKT